MFLLLLLFILSLCGTVLYSVLKKYTKLPKRFADITAIISLTVQLIALIVSLKYGNGLPSAAVILLIAEMLITLPSMLLFKGKLPSALSSNEGVIRNLICMTSLLLIAEVSVFNFPTYAMMLPGAPEERTYITNDFYAESEESKSYSIEDVGSKIQTLYVDIELKNAVKNSVSIANSDETNHSLRTLSSVNYINGDDSTKYILCSYFGTVDKLQLTIRADKDSEVNVSKIVINKVIPFRFSLTRFLIIWALAAFVIIMRNSPYMKEEAGKSDGFKYWAVILTVIFIMIGTSLFLVRDNVNEYLKNPDTNQINRELVDSFAAGQVSMIEEPNEGILSLSNPYDWSLRLEEGTTYLWDHLLYEGKFYSYYGIGTVLTFFLPYYLITGKYFSSVWATFLYSEAGILFLSLAYYVFIKRFFPKISTAAAASGLVIVQSASFVWYCITIGNFYELAQVSGFAFITAGTYFMLRSGVIGEGKVSLRDICISTTLLSIAVLCRAALALYCLVSLILIFSGLLKTIETPEKLSFAKRFSKNQKNAVRYLCAAMLPYILIGSVQMIYNYTRFGSILDFGISYTLTIYDYQHIQFQLPLTFIAIYNYMFTLPKLGSEFPFITSNYVSLNVNGYYYLAGFSSAGIIFRAIPVLGYIYSFKAYRLSESKYRKTASAVILFGSLIIPFVQMALIWEYGYTPRYAVDFAWEMLFGAFAVIFTLYNSMQENTKQIFTKFMIASAVLSFIINMDLTYEFVLDAVTGLNISSKETISSVVSFGRIFEFWNLM